MSETRAAHTPTVTIHLDRPRTLAFTLGAVQRIKDATGISVLALARQGEGALKEALMDHIGVFLWAMLVKEDRDITAEDLADLIHLGNLDQVATQLGGLMGASAPPQRSPSGEGAAGNGGEGTPAPPAS